jgi:hypothetical protein
MGFPNTGCLPWRGDLGRRSVRHVASVLRDDGLFIRQGWRKNLVPYASLVEVQSVSDSRSAAVFSTDRILILTQEGKRFVIAVEDDARFFSELAQRSPQLELRAFGLDTPLSPPVII